MRPTLLLAAALATPALAAAQPTVIPGFASPESVLVAGDRAYVSNIGAALDPLAHDGDGFISLLSADGTVLERHALPSDGSRLDAPKGMAVTGGILYVADIDRIAAFDTATGARRPDHALPPGGPAFANDLAAEPAGTLLVTDTLRNAVYRLDPATGGWTLLTDAIPGANGIALDAGGQTATIAGIGAGFTGGDIYTLPLAPDPSGAPDTPRPAPQRLAASPHGLLDGIALRPDGTVLVSDWIAFDPPVPGQILAVTPGGTTTPVATPPLTGPADFALTPDGHLWIPSIPTNSVTILPPA